MKCSITKHNLKHAMEGLKKVVRYVLDADDSLNSHQNIIITFLANLQCSLKFACKFIPWYLH